MTDTVKTADNSTKADATPSPKSSPTKKDIDIATEALNHLAQGKRHLLVNDITSAVNSLQEACRLLAEHYGETAPECGDAYFYYGKALLELARIENGVLGNALDGVPEGDDMENSQVEDPQKMTEEGSTEDEEEDNDSKDGDESQGEENENSKEGEGENSKEENDEEDSQEGEKTEDEEEVSNLQLAWEMLELSKVIYTKQEEGNPAMKLKKAQVYLKLGEVGLESENYPQSVEDLTKCLEIQSEELPADSRCLAETHYQLGVAHSFSDDFDKAMESFRAASNVIETRISNLKEKAKEKLTWTEEQKKKDAIERVDPFYTEQAEIDELDKLLPEIKEKIVDMEEMKKDSKEKLQKLKESTFASVLGGSRASTSGESASGASTSKALQPPSAFSEGSVTTFSQETSKPASNISHLVRKKRKPEDEVVKEDAKKVKNENGESTPAVNGNKASETTPENMDVDDNVKTSEVKQKVTEEAKEEIASTV